MNNNMILVLDFGGQYCHLISRRVRDAGVYSEIRPFDVSIQEVKHLDVKGIILSGGPGSVYEEDAPRIEKSLLGFCKEREIPVLGLCYGHQLIAQLEGGTVAANPVKEYGKTTLEVVKQDGIFNGLAEKETVWMSHGDQVTHLPDGFEVLARTATCPIAAYRSTDGLLHGLQFHPEVNHTPKGKMILSNFVFSICNCEKNWSIADWTREAIARIKDDVGKRHVLLGLSGGVDSTVVSVLMQRAIGEQLHCVFVDNGVMRKDEGRDVEDYFRNTLNYQEFYRVDAEDEFLTKLAGIRDPEEKRKIIGHTFIEVFERKAGELASNFGKLEFLAQGTIYPDRVETAATSKSAAKIKSHHNLTLPEDMELKVIEPLKDLYKDEVRQVGKELGIPEEIINRHPFPGPGLAVRCVGEVKKEYLDILREADAILIEEIRHAGLYNDLWQAFAVFLPSRTVGVMGDFRTYEYICAIRVVESRDAMTANFAKLPWDLLETISTRIINEVSGINRVVYDISNKPPSTIEFE
ncbi:glutamine-hydrolyzing GMP synthase [Candidatus Bathyarchaeota archaeon]|nr:glutamine-hydrolyzing GMP synthase [Candidatus Bathyarchaeota archaeon]